MFEELAETAREELKRADHSIFVSLKYAKTVDILKNTVKRLISACELGILEVSEFLKKKKKIKVVPAVAKLRADLALKYFPETKEFIDFYFFLKNIDKAKFDKKEEYRKNVTLIITVDNKKVDMNIEMLKEFYKKAIEFIDLVDNIVGNK